MNTIPNHTGFKTGSLSSRAMIMSLNISQWSGRALDRQITDEVNSSHGASSDAGRYNKLLIDKKALEGITKVASKARTEFTTRTLPWMNDGSRIMAADTYLKNASTFRKLRGEFFDEVEEFLRQYPGYINDARIRLNGMFRDEDYPEVTDLRTRFDFKVSVMPVPDAQDFRVDIGDDIAAHLRSEIEKNVNEATTAAVRDVYRRVAEVCERMVEKLNGYKPAKRKGQKSEGIFRDSLVENVRELITVLPSLNITGDPELTRLADKLAPLAAWDAQVLRENEGRRRDVAAEAQDILDQVRGFIA